jgi:ABC-type nitrate/sulfonate/bicarbonate transport system substrate-binding protein
MEAPMMKKRPVFSMILPIVAGLLAVLPAAEAAKLRLGVYRSVNGVPDVVAHRLGYFKKYGLLYTTNYFKQGKSGAQRRYPE